MIPTKRTRRAARMMATSALMASTAAAWIAAADEAGSNASGSVSADVGASSGAESPHHPIGLRIAAGLGYMLPSGTLQKDPSPGPTQGQNQSLGDLFAHGVPIFLDASYRIDPSIDLGLSGQIAFLSADNHHFGCGENGVECSGGMSTRIGVEARYRLAPDAQLDPWVGVGIGYEWAHISAASATESWAGFELAHLELGSDYAINPRIGVGPVIAFSLAQYQRQTVSGPGVSASATIPYKALHEWFTFGVRGVYDL